MKVCHLTLGNETIKCEMKLLNPYLVKGKKVFIGRIDVNFDILVIFYLKVIYHPLYSMNNYVHIWGDWLSCDL